MDAFRYEVFGYLWLIWGMANFTIYVWLEFFFEKGISFKLSSRVKGSIIERWAPSPSAIKSVASTGEYSKYLSQRRHRRFWANWVLLPSMLALGAANFLL